jgi:ketosteroid isomerase-like protein
MAAVDVFGQVVEQYNLALGEFLKGNPEPLKKMYSHREEITLANPFGPPVRGWDEVAATLERAASHFRDGEMVGFDHIAEAVTAELAYIVEVERSRAKVDGREESTPVEVRVTTIFRPEDGEWKVVHRHADPITTAQPAESVIQK